MKFADMVNERDYIPNLVRRAPRTKHYPKSRCKTRREVRRPWFSRHSGVGTSRSVSLCSTRTRAGAGARGGAREARGSGRRAYHPGRGSSEIQSYSVPFYSSQTLHFLDSPCRCPISSDRGRGLTAGGRIRCGDRSRQSQHGGALALGILGERDWLTAGRRKYIHSVSADYYGVKVSYGNHSRQLLLAHSFC